MSTFVYQVNGTDILAKRAELTRKGVSIDTALEELRRDIDGIGSFQIVERKVDGHPDVSNPTHKVIYLWRSSESEQKDPYEEWIYTGTNTWEMIGETSLDLSPYAKTVDVQAMIAELDATVTSSNGTNIAVQIVEVDGKVTAVNITKDDTVNISTYNAKMQELDASISGINTSITNLGSTKADKVTGQFTANNFAALDSNGNLKDSGKKAADFVDSTAYATKITSIEGDIEDLQDNKANKVNPATDGNFASLNGYGDLTDSGKKAADFATAAQGAKADSAIQGVKCSTDSALTPDSNKIITLPEASASVYGVVTVGYVDIEDLNPTN